MAMTQKLRDCAELRYQNLIQGASEKSTHQADCHRLSRSLSSWSVVSISLTSGISSVKSGRTPQVLELLLTGIRYEDFKKKQKNILNAWLKADQMEVINESGGNYKIRK